MSRHTIARDSEREIVVGWDPPLGTFFAHIYDVSTRDMEEDLIDSIGHLPGAVVAVEDIAEWLLARGHTLSEWDTELLRAESQQPWKPGPLQRALGFTGAPPPPQQEE
jgi:hypothetical protein